MRSKKTPRDTDAITWTKHATAKMWFYGISENAVKKILRDPARHEEGIAPYTAAVMRPFGSPTKDGRLPYRGEVWVMYKSARQASPKSQVPNPKRIISVWRYPGKSPVRDAVPIPDDIRNELAL